MRRLKWLVDINDYPMQDIDIEKFNSLVVYFRAGRIVGQANNLLEKFFNTEMLSPGNKNIPGYLIRFALRSINSEVPQEQSTFDILCNYRNQWLMFPGFYYKWRTLTSMLYRPGDIQLVDSSWKIAYYLYRPYSFLKRRVLHL